MLIGLRLGENTAERLCRPAWNSENNFEAHNHCWDRHLVRFFYVHTEGLFKKIVEKRTSTAGKRKGV